VLFRSDAQRRALFASLNNRFSHVSAGSGIADAVINLYPESSNSVGTSGDVGDKFANAILGLWPGGKEQSIDNKPATVLRYPMRDFSQEEIMLAREEFEHPEAWVFSKEGENYVLYLDKKLLDKNYGDMYV
jgi:hypothetical protein